MAGIYFILYKQIISQNLSNELHIIILSIFALYSCHVALFVISISCITSIASIPLESSGQPSILCSLLYLLENT